MRLALLGVALLMASQALGEEVKVSFGGNGALYYQGARWGSEGPSGTGFTANLELSVEPAPGGELYGRLHAGEGEGADGELSDHLFANLNTLADDNPEEGSVELLEFYYRHELVSKKLTLLVGKTEPFILIDSNEFAGDEINQFTGKPFVNNPIIDSEARFAPAVAFDWELSERFSLQAFAQSSDRGNLYWNGQEWASREKSVYSNPFDHPTLALQGTYSTGSGNYRVYLWADTSPHPRVSQIKNPDRRPETVKGIVAGLSFDEKLTERLGVFGRASVGRKSAYPFWQFYSFGFNLSSPFSSRPDDTFAFGAAAILPSPLYQNHSTEVHFETYYRLALSDRLSLNPDLQVVLNPGGNGGASPVYSFTLKLVAEF